MHGSRNSAETAFGVTDEGLGATRNHVCVGQFDGMLQVFERPDVALGQVAAKSRQFPRVEAAPVSVLTSGFGEFGFHV